LYLFVSDNKRIVKKIFLQIINGKLTPKDKIPKIIKPLENKYYKTIILVIKDLYIFFYIYKTNFQG